LQISLHFIRSIGCTVFRGRRDARGSQHGSLRSRAPSQQECRYLAYETLIYTESMLTRCRMADPFEQRDVPSFAPRSLRHSRDSPRNSRGASPLIAVLFSREISGNNLSLSPSSSSLSPPCYSPMASRSPEMNDSHTSEPTPRLFLSLSLSDCARSHTHTHTHTRARKHTYIRHTQAHAYLTLIL